MFGRWSNLFQSMASTLFSTKCPLVKFTLCHKIPSFNCAVKGSFRNNYGKRRNARYQHYSFSQRTVLRLSRTNYVYQEQTMVLNLSNLLFVSANCFPFGQVYNFIMWRTLYHTIPTFNDPKERASKLKTLWEKKKMLVTSIFFFSHNVLYLIQNKSCYFDL